jgi:hypothetical protein
MNKILNIRDFGMRMENVLKVYPSAIYVGRLDIAHDIAQSPLANPYNLKNKNDDRERGLVLEKYRSWLWEMVKKEDQRVLAALRAVQPDTILVCWCAPKPCHAEVIARAAQWLRAQNQG